MHVIQIETDWWLVTDDVLGPRYLIHRGPAVHQVTHETHVMYRVIWWQMEKSRRETRGYFDTFREAEEWCRAAIAEAQKRVTPGLPGQSE